MKKFILAFIISMVALGFSPVKAQTTDANVIMKKSERALDAMHGGSRKMVVRLTNADGFTQEWTARRAQKAFKDETRDLMVFMEPQMMRGIAFLAWKHPGRNETVQWMYLTFLRRTIKMTDYTIYTPFFATDYLFADLDIISPPGAEKFLVEEPYKDKMIYKIESTPRVNIYYSKIISYIDKKTYLPLQRDYYDLGGKLWKKKSYENFMIIDNIPMAIEVAMEDLQTGSSTRFIFSEICRDVTALTREDFEPDVLRNAPASPVCTIRPPQSK